MNYYQIGLDFESNGLKNDINQIEINKDEIKKNDVYKEFLEFFNTKNIDFWYNQDKIKKIEIPIIYAKVIKKAKVTDIMGYTPNISFLNNVYSEKYIDILKDFNIGNYSTFEVAIENVAERYFMLFVETILNKDIIFEDSIVYTGHKVLKNLEYLKFSNFGEYWDFLQRNPLARFEKISISKEYFGRDIIKIQGPDPFYSEKFIDFLLNREITGLKVYYKNSIQLEFV